MLFLQVPSDTTISSLAADFQHHGVDIPECYIDVRRNGTAVISVPTRVVAALLSSAVHRKVVPLLKQTPARCEAVWPPVCEKRFSK